MSGAGAPVVEVDGRGLRVAVVAACWHEQVMDGLVAGALRGLADAQVADPIVVRVPGTFELPVAAARLATSGVDAVVALGVVIRGGTPHFEYVCQGATSGLVDVSVRTGVPVGFGVLTCDNEEQALDRAGLPGSAEDKGHEAATAAVATAVALADVGAPALSLRAPLDVRAPREGTSGSKGRRGRFLRGYSAASRFVGHRRRRGRSRSFLVGRLRGSHCLGLDLAQHRIPQSDRVCHPEGLGVHELADHPGLVGRKQRNLKRGLGDAVGRSTEILPGRCLEPTGAVVAPGAFEKHGRRAVSLGFGKSGLDQLRTDSPVLLGG
jgi:6,7-dimethyl-8-ribityllumazine synthase